MVTTTANPFVMPRVGAEFIGLQNPIDSLFSYNAIYHNTNNGFAVEFRKQMIGLHTQGLKLQEIADKLNCSVSVVKKWLRRYREGDIIADKSRAPIHREVKNTQFNQHMVKEILEQFPFYGSRRIAHTIEKEIGVKVSHVTVSQMMKDIQEKKEPVVAEVIEIDEPDKIWHMDMTPVRLQGGKTQYIFAIIDACTRRVMAIKNYSGCTAVEVIDCLYAAIINNGGKKPRILYTDNGGQFVAKTFENVLKVQTIFHHKTDKGCPWQNGKIERLFKTLFDEWIAYNRYGNEKSLKESLDKFREWFNNEREIQKLGYKTPAQIMKEKQQVSS
jgi:transposase InsO family protein